MFREHENVKEYKNGNLTIKLDREQIEDINKTDIEFIIDLLYWMDCYFVGDDYCINNYEMGHSIYNAYSDKIYVFPWSDLDRLKRGELVRLYAITPDKWDREVIEDYGL